jgi:hypothetical protein
MPADHDEIGTPAWEARVLRRQAEHLDANGQSDTAASVRRRADELDPPATAEPGTTDLRDAHHEWIQRLDIDDTVGTDTVALFSLLRDVADHEPVAVIGPPGHARMHCTQCDKRSEHHSEPVTHRIWCPWVRVTQIVGTAPDAKTITRTVTLTGGDADSHAAARDAISDLLGKEPDPQYPDVEVSTDGGTPGLRFRWRRRRRRGHLYRRRLTDGG